MKNSIGILIIFFSAHFVSAQQASYPQHYFRSPLNIPMQLVANFGEIRANHWHMGLDVRTQQRVNLPVYAAADGYIARVSVEPGGFGQAIYINHPNGYTTVYGHLNAFAGALASYVKQQQYAQERWAINLLIPPNMFPVKQGDQIALSGSTGASEGPHVHFEIRDTKTENCLNPLLFGFPIADVTPPTLARLALYDRNRSTWEQTPVIFALKKKNGVYTSVSEIIHTGSNKISFAVSAVDHFTGSSNPNGIFSAKIFFDGRPVSEFVLNNISYTDTRYINAQLDYPWKMKNGSTVQHISPLPGITDVVYNLFGGDGLIHLQDKNIHSILIEVKDANENISRVELKIQFDETLSKTYSIDQGERFLPGNINIFERDHFQLYTSPQTIYDTIAVSFNTVNNQASDAVSLQYSFLNASIPSHDSITVSIAPNEGFQPEWKDRVVIKNISGSKTVVAKALYHKGWFTAKFRQFGTFQAFVDLVPPTINAPLSDLSKATHIVFIPKDNFNSIKKFRADLDGNWLRFTNDKGHSWIYYFDEKFPPGEHELKITIEDEAGNVTVKTWQVRR